MTEKQSGGLIFCIHMAFLIVSQHFKINRVKCPKITHNSQEVKISDTAKVIATYVPYIESWHWFSWLQPNYTFKTAISLINGSLIKYSIFKLSSVNQKKSQLSSTPHCPSPTNSTLSLK